MKILIVEDDFVARKLLNILLSKLGQVDIAINGQEAIDAVNLAFDDSAPYELICLDVMMPHVDGITALKEIRAIETQHGLNNGSWSKVIMTTALSDKEHVIAAGQAQCNAYLIKPITRSRLFEVLQNWGFSSLEEN